MAKAKITITSTYEYEINPEFYEKGMSLDDCLNVDIKNAENDPAMLLDMDGAELEVTGELLKDF